MVRFIAALSVLGLMVVGCAAHAQSRFDGWASAVIAADWRDGDGRPIAAFDNAQRDLTTAFQRAGFDPDAMVSVSLRPDVANPVEAEDSLRLFAEAAQRAPRGCLFYVTSHGSPEGLVFGPEATLEPERLIPILRRICGERPTVVVLSACFSGIFVDGLKAPNRMVMTAARRDRSSFGCAADATYPYFDECVLDGLKSAPDFIALSRATTACVAAREQAEDLTPASEPQTAIGATMQILLPTLRFRPSGDTNGS
ncbi:C13 family peptidase [Brevundimonas sp. SL130]|uniref:C13 family peptidase n=1 Tax=Brevundimonas sp. SL130 TaxID=2995143 RepID=UPI00226C6A9E|nr:C13 family peptidase [Brevundimonas sp. SL130]WAC58436.1 peptidase C13 [Brevundimonas sp. SL130]